MTILSITRSWNQHEMGWSINLWLPLFFNGVGPAVNKTEYREEVSFALQVV